MDGWLTQGNDIDASTLKVLEQIKRAGLAEAVLDAHGAQLIADLWYERDPVDGAPGTNGVAKRTPEPTVDDARGTTPPAHIGASIEEPCPASEDWPWPLATADTDSSSSEAVATLEQDSTGVQVTPTHNAPRCVLRSPSRAIPHDGDRR